MPLPTRYNTGTASVSANATAVTGQGTAWAAALKPGDLFGVHRGLSVPIASVNSNTSLTLAYSWPGAAQSAAAYDIQLTPPSVGVMEGVRVLLEQLGNGNLQALAGLTSAADRIAYFNGPGSAALATFTAKGRELVGANNALAALSALGPVFGGATPTPIAAGVGLSDGNFNDIVVAGAYTIANAWTNGPFGAASTTYTGVLMVSARNFNNGYWQELFLGERRFRRYNSTSGGLTGWSPWRAMAGEAVGSVSNSNGFINGAMIERGSNANGEYVRFADGTQICWCSLPAVPVDLPQGSIFRSDLINWTYPASFFSAATTMGFVTAGASTFWANGNFTSAFTTQARLYSAVTSASGTTINLGAIGRWAAP